MPISTICEGMVCHAEYALFGAGGGAGGGNAMDNGGSGWEVTANSSEVAY